MSQQKTLTILIADDHPLFRESLALMLLNMPQHQPQQTTILQAEDAHICLDMVKENPDITMILTDIDMPGMDGLALLQQLKKLLPDIPVVMISGSDKHAHIQQALKFGASGFIPKSSTTPILFAALQLVLAGGIYLPPILLESAPPPHLASKTPSTLTERQQEILFFLQQGMQNKMIAHTLDLSEATVKVHVRGVFSVLGVKNRTQAVQKALEEGLL
ncbi:MAG: response regulator transcription factor [Mariprofundaceae bacterium]|nr:response regulator transcription factor [Mariprofundaceae bacterium]